MEHTHVCVVWPPGYTAIQNNPQDEQGRARAYSRGTALDDGLAQANLVSLGHIHASRLASALHYGTLLQEQETGRYIKAQLGLFVSCTSKASGAREPRCNTGVPGAPLVPQPCDPH